MTNTRPVPGIRRRRHEAARTTLEKHGWTLRRVDGSDGTRHYTHPKHANGLMVGTGGALYWTQGHGSLPCAQARAGQATGIGEALEAVRRVR